MRRSAVSVLVAGVVLLSACSGGSNGSVPPPTVDSAVDNPTAPVAGDPAAVVTEFDGDPARIGDLNQIALQGPDVIEAIAPALDDPDPNVRWAAAYTIGIAADSIDAAQPLIDVIDDPEETIRVVAAGRLIGLGETRAIPVLVDATGSKGSMAFSDPQVPTAGFARDALAAYTGQDFPAASDWRDWWKREGSDLSWNGSAYV